MRSLLKIFFRWRPSLSQTQCYSIPTCPVTSSKNFEKMAKIIGRAVFAFYFMFINECNGEAFTTGEMRKIKQAILKDYDPEIIPIIDNRPLNVTVSIHIKDMVPLESSEMHFSIDFQFGLRWNDYRLKYNTTHNDVEQIPFDHQFLKQIWIPDLYFTTAKKGIVHSLPQPNALVSLQSDGTVFVERRLTVESFCPMDFLYYPFDIQNCNIFIESYSYNEHYIILNWRKNRSANTYKKATDQYHIDKFSQVNIEPFEGLIEDYFEYGKYSRLQLEFELYRNLRMYFLRDFLPCILITALSWITFWINYESTPARVALGITTVLTIVTMTNSVKMSAPAVSTFRSIDYYLFVCNLFVFAALCEYAIVGMTPPKKEKKKKKKMVDYKTNPKEIHNSNVSFREGIFQFKSWNDSNGFARQPSGETQLSSRSISSSIDAFNLDLHKESANNSLDDLAQQKTKSKTFKISLPRLKTISQTHWLDRTCRIGFPFAFLFTNVVFFVFHRLNPKTVN